MGYEQIESKIINDVTHDRIEFDVHINVARSYMSSSEKMQFLVTLTPNGVMTEPYYGHKESERMKVYQIRTDDGYHEYILENPRTLLGEWSIVTLVKPIYTVDGEICGCKKVRSFHIHPSHIVGYEVIEFEESERMTEKERNFFWYSYLCYECKQCEYKDRCTRTNIKKHDGECWKDKTKREER